jgi:intraflagellar transport protein 56
MLYHLRTHNPEQARVLMDGLDPSTPIDYVMKATVLATLGQQPQGAPEDLIMAKSYFELVGASPGECDTILGRQSMASALFLGGQFEDVMVYMNSIKVYAISFGIYL